MSALYPMSPVPRAFSETRGDWQALTQRGVGGVRETLERLTGPLFAASHAYPLQLPGETAILDAFHQSRRGPALAFYLVSFDPYVYRALVRLGPGNSTAKAWPAPIFALDETTYAAAALAIASAAKTRGTHWAIGVENRCLQSEDFSVTATWAVIDGATVTRTSGQTDPLGGALAWRIQTSGGASTPKLQQQIGVPALAQVSRTSIWVKNLSATKAVTVIAAVGSSQVIAAAADWTQVVLAPTGDGAETHVIRFDAPAAGDALDFRVWHPQVAWTSAVFGAPASTWEYLPTGATALTADAYGRMWVALYPVVAAPGSTDLIELSAMGRWVYLCHFPDDARQIVQLDTQNGTLRALELAVQGVTA
ncbi:MAG: hypothetical protein HY825_13620 [Acidobacteria bacterium]|nr:hypothetical protein [Acidobacteriota bacterium]